MANNNDAGKLRRSAVIMTFGPGSIVDMRADDGNGGPIAGCATGLEEWDENAPLGSAAIRNQTIVEPRLMSKLGVRTLRLAPVVSKSGASESLVLRRFPTWLQCPECDVIQVASSWFADPGKASRICASCTQKRPGLKSVFVAPVRFVVACENGHLDEFPWHFWVRHKTSCLNTRGKLQLKSEGAGLAGLWLSCPSCKSRKNLDGIFSKVALRGQSCRGKRPWLREDDSECNCSGEDGSLRVVQRGASNLYYPIHESALDIPPWTNSLEVALGSYWADLEDCIDDSHRLRMVQSVPGLQEICNREGLNANDLVSHFSSRSSQLEGVQARNLRIDEYRVFTENRQYSEGEFQIRPRSILGSLSGLLSHVARVPRLREVRALTGFTRIHPPVEGQQHRIAPLSVSKPNWLPATELRGEGIYIGFNEASLQLWESNPDVVERIRLIAENWKKTWTDRGGSGEMPCYASPRFLMIHSFAHALINQLTLECGYSSSALRERLYISTNDERMSGVLIFTGTPDSEGTLGGLEIRGSDPTFEDTVSSAIASQSWCSSDPLCAPGLMAAPESHSLASCHSCVLLPETACEHHNNFLDRVLLVGTDENPSLGYFSEWAVR